MYSVAGCAHPAALPEYMQRSRAGQAGSYSRRPKGILLMRQWCLLPTASPRLTGQQLRQHGDVGLE